MSQNKQLWLLAGGDGAGKSTFYHTRLAPLCIPFINADQIAKELFPNAPETHSYRAARVAAEMRETLIKQGRSFCFETVFSHVSKIDFVAQAKARGYEVILVFIHVDSIGLNKARIAQRVEAGGHNVPYKKVEDRIPRLLANIKTVLPLCDNVYVLDNSKINNPYQMIFTIRHCTLEKQRSPLPDWAEELLTSSSN